MIHTSTWEPVFSKLLAINTILFQSRQAQPQLSFTPQQKEKAITCLRDYQQQHILQKIEGAIKQQEMRLVSGLYDLSSVAKGSILSAIHRLQDIRNIFLSTQYRWDSLLKELEKS
ncbi:MAG: hypothetical protein ACD_17C00075G0001 [uncultured bacterium]|nr:MAG: hypothetical protein ACD_17C00075G0001 [uncultured bacterium]OGN55578.1 MAG: hypothetical protein A2796_04405 [Chlamydiae bacterium RIFCSPHIGHO2_01_FULL_44_39]OGN57789.1 MAG: hypothetical protein A3C42_06325 [Chlamydiae bacterium RIFCSPHIGHO2_02_FULL_45_9]OGN60115.1 MAG: hypothetical protein A3D96_04090 [Chlamydiae bacterium RIFCSPHIGHO2_12_FULL_44_59]OGN66272.1 MAG: hypothetical protein A2978_00040 [Chlamydiae bacterium RIFCSPLOWO2_01_FULL_44_52]OGN68920.1 MAG: hypothetical protein A3